MTLGCLTTITISLFARLCIWSLKTYSSFDTKWQFIFIYYHYRIQMTAYWSFWCEKINERKRNFGKQKSLKHHQPSVYRRRTHRHLFHVLLTWKLYLHFLINKHVRGRPSSICREQSHYFLSSSPVNLFRKNKHPRTLFVDEHSLSYYTYLLTARYTKCQVNSNGTN